MDFEEAQQIKYLKMTGDRVSRLICRLAAPTIASMLITSLYNMADTFFVSQISTSASGAVGIVFSLMAMIQAIGFTLGVGAGSNISRMLGRRDIESASRAASTAFFAAVACGAVLTVFGLTHLDGLVRLLGATETILPHAREYAFYILLGAPYMAGSFVLNNVLRAQGSATSAMIGITLGGVLNVVLDPIFIFTFNMGIGGAALATILSQFVSFLVLLYHCRGQNGNIRITPRNVTLQWPLFRTVLSTGAPSFYRQGLASFASVLLNVYSAPFGDGAVAAMSIVTRIMMFTVSALLGFGQAFQPVCGFNCGAGRYDRVIDAFWFTIKTSAVFLSLIGAAGFVFAPGIIAVFRRTDAQVIEIGARALRLQCAILPVQSVIIVTNMFFQAIGRNVKAAFIATCRQGLFFIPAITTLPPLFGVLGVQMSQPVADVLTFACAIFLLFGIMKEFYGLKKSQPENGARDAVLNAEI